MKYFVITIDTEGDNLWQWDKKSPITTENTTYLIRFQKLAEQYGFKPVWLTNFEMISDPRYVDFIVDVEERKVGEVGMHLHAWNTPPLFTLPKIQSGLPYLIEYPEGIMRNKVETMTSLIEKKTGVRPTSHRAGRWSRDERYFRILKDFGYTVDCSVTPHHSWQSSPGQTEINGTDFSGYPEQPYWVDIEQTLLEVPVNIRPSHFFVFPESFTLKNVARNIRDAYRGYNLWLRPNGKNEKQMLYFLNVVNDSEADYIMFMLHSSELMPGGSPAFGTEHAIEQLYITLQHVFSKAAKLFSGITLRDYRNVK